MAKYNFSNNNNNNKRLKISVDQKKGPLKKDVSHLIFLDPDEQLYQIGSLCVKSQT